ncbi:hypothetical protein [Nocardioides pacificus]
MSTIDPARVRRDLLTAGRAAPTRRAALRGGAVALAVLGGAGCDASDGGRATTSPSVSSPSGRTDDEVADAQLAAEALGHIDATLALVAAVTTRHAVAGPLVGDLVGAHVAHRDLLLDAVAGTEEPDAVTSPPDAQRAWSGLRRREQTLQAQLGALALRAGSGPFARLLAVMAASVAQHLAALPLTLPPASGGSA